MQAQTLWEGMVGGKPVQLVVQDNTFTFEPLTEGVLSNIASGIWSFAKAHPIISTITGLSVYDAFKQYQINKQKTVRLSAKDKSERNHMKPVIDMMVKSGYTIVNQSYKGANGYEWELKSK